MYKFLGLMLLSFCVFACDREYSYQYLATHPKVLEQVLTNCQQMSMSEVSQNMTCINAENARREVAGLLSEITTNIQGFGQKILAAQTRLADLKAQDQQHPSDTTQAAIQAQQDKIARLLAITSYVGE